MRVHGTSGLRVVDASAMPYVTNGNIYAPVMMIAEKAADLIMGNTPLPPMKTPFYRLPGRLDPVLVRTTRRGRARCCARCASAPGTRADPVGPSSRPLPERFMPPHSAPGT